MTGTRERLDRYLLFGGVLGVLFLMVVLLLVGLFLATILGVQA